MEQSKAGRTSGQCDGIFARLKTVDARGIIVTSQSSEFDFVSRFFAPQVGINEDPVTGSAHCCLAAYWQKRLHKSEFTAYQASDRGGVVQLRIKHDRVFLGGAATMIFRGELLFDEVQQLAVKS